MKKWILASMALMSLGFTEEPQPDIQSNPCPIRHGFLEGKIGYFYPFSSDLRSVFSGSADYEISFTYILWRQLSIFTSVDFFIKEGRSTGDHSKTSIWILPITLGLKAVIPVYCSLDRAHAIDLYFSLAPRYFLVNATNNVDYLDHTNFAQGIGGVGGLGAIYSYKHFSLGTFLDASFGNVRSHTSIDNVKTPYTQVGGLVAGGSIGYNF